MGVLLGADGYLRRGATMSGQPRPQSIDGVDLVYDPVSDEWIDPRSMPNRYAGSHRPPELPPSKEGE